MSSSSIRNLRLPCITVIALSLCLGAGVAVGQVVTNTTGAEVAQLQRQIVDLQIEMRSLRERDAHRQEWEASIARRLPSTDYSYVSASHGFRYDDERSVAGCNTRGLPGCGCTASPSCGGYGAGCGCCCGCYPCECPLPEAPCIECPRISTLSPHSNIHIFGAFVADMLFNEARPVSPGSPYYLSPASPGGLDQGTVDVHARSSYLGAAVTGPQMANFQAGGMAMLFFYNDNVLADQYGVLPAQIWGDLKNEEWRFAAGLQFDVFNPASPTMLPFSVLCGSGNAGNAWRGQLRVERFISPHDEKQWTIQAALSEPVATVISPEFRTLSEDNGWPNVEGRIALGLGPLEAVGLEAKRPFELGVSGVVGQVRSTPAAASRVVVDVWGAGMDLRWQFSECMGISGEVYTGRALGTYNGAALQTINVDTLEGIRSSGGWGEVFYYWTPCLHSHIGYGIDDPDDDDLSPNPLNFQRERNETIFANLIWDINQAFRIGLEATYRETENTSAFDNDGIGFQTQFRWAF